MDILFHVATEAGAVPAGARGLSPWRPRLRRLLHPRGARAADAELQAALADARAVACEDSWHRFCAGAACPVELGSQTTNSALMGEAKKVVSL